MRRTIFGAAIILFMPAAFAIGADAEPAGVDYLRDVKPILAERCYAT